MSKIQTQNFDKRKAQIANTAAALFAKHGYHGASIIDIAKACGTAKSRLYYYFSSKEDLLYYLLKDHAGLLAFRLGGALSGHGSPQDKLLVYTKELLAINIRARDRHAIILSEMDKLSPVHRAEITAAFARAHRRALRSFMRHKSGAERAERQKISRRYAAHWHDKLEPHLV